MEVAGDLQRVKDPESRRASIHYLARYIEDGLSTRPRILNDKTCSGRCRRCLARCCCLWLGRRYGNFLVALYLLIKLFYIVNVIGQFWLMNRYLGTNYTLYGIDLMKDLSEGRMWQESGHFPRITLCDFEIRRLGNVHRHTVQCVLPINMFNEKIYIFLWFWFVVVGTVATYSSCTWIFRSLIPSTRTRYIRKFLKLRSLLNMGDRRKSIAFVDSFLRPDGVFIVRLIAQNAGELAAAEVVEKLWVAFKHRPVGLLSSPLHSPHRHTAPLGGIDSREKAPAPPPPSVAHAVTLPRGLVMNAVAHSTFDSESGANSKRRTGPTLTNRNRQSAVPVEDDPGEFV